MYDYKKLIGELLGAVIAVVWVAYGILGAGNQVFLVVAISLTILLGVLAGGLIAISTGKKHYKEVMGWLFGAAIAVVWVVYAMLYSSDMVFLVVAISLTILFGVLSGGLIKLGTKTK